MTIKILIKRFSIPILCMIQLMVVTSCVSVKVNVLKEYPARPVDCPLDVYMIEDDIKKPYEEICILDSRTGTNLFSKKTYEQAIKLAKPMACKCGADAILVTSVDKQGVNLLHYGRGSAVVKGLRYK